MVKYIIYSLSLFILGLVGIIFTRKNIIIILMCVELMLLAVNVNFIVFSVYLDDIMGEIFSLFVLTVAAAESAIGLAIIVVFYRMFGEIISKVIKELKG